MKHHVTLDTCHRAHDPALQQLVSEVQEGLVSDEMMEVAKRLERELAPDMRSQAIHLFATNWECDYHNGERLAEILSPAEVFVSEDDGQCSKFHSTHTPRKLRLKACIFYVKIVSSMYCAANLDHFVCSPNMQIINFGGWHIYMIFAILFMY